MKWSDLPDNPPLAARPGVRGRGIRDRGAPPRGTDGLPLTLSCLSSCRWGGEYAVDFTSDIALQAAHDLAFGQPLQGPASDIGSGSLVGAHSAHDDHVQGRVGLAVTAAVETVALRLPTRCGDRADAAHHGEARLGAEPVRVIPNGDHDCACVLGAHAFEFEQTGGELLDQGDDEPVEFSDLVVDVEDSAGGGTSGRAWSRPPGLDIRPRPASRPHRYAGVACG